MNLEYVQSISSRLKTVVGNPESRIGDSSNVYIDFSSCPSGVSDHLVGALRC